MKAKTLSWLMILLILLLLSFILWNKENNRENMLSNSSSPETALPAKLHPVVAEKKDKLVETAADKGISVVITDGFRSIEEQNSLYAQGRSEDGQIVTYAEGGESYHNYGLAIDFALQTDDGDIIWDLEHDGNNNGRSDWREVAEIGQELGFEWGGNWKRFKDYPHLQMRFGLRIPELQRGERPDQQ